MKGEGEVRGEAEAEAEGERVKLGEEA